MNPETYFMVGLAIGGSEMHSALPNAPVVPDVGVRPKRVRRATARVLRRAATRLEPVA